MVRGLPVYQWSKEAGMATQPMRTPHSTTTGPTVFGDLPPAVARPLETVTLTNHYPTGAVLFAEGQTARGIYIVQRGRLKLSVCASDGRTLILRIVEAGEALGVASTIGNREYEATAEAQEPCDVSFVRQSDVLRAMRTHGEFALWVTQHLSHDYNATCREIRTLMLSSSAGEKLARLLVGWMDDHPDSKTPGRMKMVLTHEEIGQMIGTSRETVTRLFAGFRKRRLIEQEGATLVVANRLGLESLIIA
jgi:CRP/FNR family transcriptional regulator, cyclic AMP receptor protein